MEREIEDKMMFLFSFSERDAEGQRRQRGTWGDMPSLPNKVNARLAVVYFYLRSRTNRFMDQLDCLVRQDNGKEQSNIKNRQ